MKQPEATCRRALHVNEKGVKRADMFRALNVEAPNNIAEALHVNAKGAKIADIFKASPGPTADRCIQLCTAAASHLRATARAASTAMAAMATANASTMPRRRGAAPASEGDAAMHMVAARLRHQSALPASRAFCAGAWCSAAARSKCVAASLSSADERGPCFQAP